MLAVGGPETSLEAPFQSQLFDLRVDLAERALNSGKRGTAPLAWRRRVVVRSGRVESGTGAATHQRRPLNNPFGILEADLQARRRDVGVFARIAPECPSQVCHATEIRSPRRSQPTPMTIKLHSVDLWAALENTHPEKLHPAMSGVTETDSVP